MRTAPYHGVVLLQGLSGELAARTGQLALARGHADLARVTGKQAMPGHAAKRVDERKTMPDYENFTTMRSLLVSVGTAMNLVNPDVENHHEQTAYLSYFIARELGLPEEDVLLTLYSALLHDIGSIVVEQPQSVAEIERNAREVSLVGSRMLGDLPYFEDVANVIGFSQSGWHDTVRCAIEEGSSCERLGLIASIVHLADVVSLLIKPEERVLNQSRRICDVAKACAGSEFSPQAVEAFLRIAEEEYVWMDLAHNPTFWTYFTGDLRSVSLADTIVYAKFMSRVIDYRSPFTAMHSAGVASAASKLAELAGMSEPDLMKMEIAGHLHDIGKLAVPRKILEKPGKLTNEEFNIVKEHPYYTSLVLYPVEGFRDIWFWASRHHEKLNGRGYPFHTVGDALDTGARLMAVADIFSAITEERPYRSGMSRKQVESVLSDNVHNGAICGDIVSLLLENYDEVDGVRDKYSRIAGKRYFDSMGTAA